MKCPKCGMEIKNDVCTYCGFDPNNNVKTENKYLFFIVLSIITILGSMAGSYLIVSNYGPKNGTQKVTNIVDYSNIKIEEQGLALSVKKVYDAVVVVKTYAKNQLYATGTGFVFKEDDKYGYIITNNHVIESGTNFKVLFTDDNEVDVEVVGSDVYSDIAVLKVSKEHILTVANMGSSKDMFLGDSLFAIGAPLDASTYSWSVTRGVLSGKDRVVEVSNNNSSVVMNVLQTDAAINSGNSGGPLCNVNGEVIGVINMKLASSSVEGMGFAIPIEVALEYAENFISGKAIIRPYLGISMYDLSSSIFSRETGIYIKSVEKDSPAYKAGLKEKDIIIGIDDKEVLSSSYLKYELYKHNVGDEIIIRYKRDGVEQTTKVTLGSYDVRG